MINVDKKCKMCQKNVAFNRTYVIIKASDRTYVLYRRVGDNYIMSYLLIAEDCRDDSPLGVATSRSAMEAKLKLPARSLENCLYKGVPYKKAGIRVIRIPLP